ncbi:MAG TPA: VacJ family lipoprotein [Caulobacteraceae bacterium]
MRRLVLLSVVATAFASSALGSAAAHTRGDPLERINRANFNGSRSFEPIVRPVAAFYRRLTPGVIGKAIHNVLVNLREPVVIINDLLQLRIARASEATARLVLNSTIGVAGIADVASRAGNPHRDNGFGDTLGRYGVGPGAYLFLPLAGPSTVRDLIGGGVDTALNPLRWVSFPDRTAVNLSLVAVGELDRISRTQDELDAVLADAADPYATLRSVYLQSRQAEIDEGRSKQALPDLPPLEDPAEPPPPAPASVAPAVPAEPAAPAAQGAENPSQDAQLDAPIATAVLEGARAG